LLNHTNLLGLYSTMARRKTVAKYAGFYININILQFPDGN